MNQDFDDEDFHSLSERIIPLTSPRNSNRNHLIKSFDNKLSHKIYESLPTQANPGDIIKLIDGTRKKFNGSSWRRLCSKPDCNYYTQCGGLCKPHLGLSKKRKLSIDNKDNSKQINDHQLNTNDKIISSNDEQQNQHVCIHPTCSVIVEHPNSLCSHHNKESNDKNQFQSPLHKRQRLNSPTQIPVPSQIQKSIPKGNRRLSIVSIPPSVDLNNPKKGDIIQMENGSRKKFDGIVWRKTCSMPSCFIAAQRNELCRKHFIKLNGKPNQDLLTLQKSLSKNVLNVSNPSIDEKSRSQLSIKDKDESLDDNTSFSYNPSDDEIEIHEENHLQTQINSLTTNRQKFSTNYLKGWLDEHRNHPYPNNQEKLQLAQQSSLRYDQVTTWFNNARAILRRRQIKQENSLNNIDQSSDENNQHSNTLFNVDQSSPLINDVCCRSIGVQCNPSTVNQTTSTSGNISIMTDEELISDRTIKILTPSLHVLETMNTSQNNENVVNDDEDDENNREIIITSTCLDDNQLTRLNEFCLRFNIKLRNVVDEFTTHLITDEEQGETLVCPLSKKVIQAVARHMFIITYRWIDACLQINKIINEKPFEIQGDLTLSSNHHGMQRSRQSVLPNRFPKNLLFENFSIMLKCDGCQQMLNNDELIELIQLSGAQLVTNSHFSILKTNLMRIVLCEKEYLINRKQMYEKCLNVGIHFLTPEWFLESLVQYRIQPYQEYEISP